MNKEPLLAATWNAELAYQYAEAVGEECRAGGIGILLGPGLMLDEFKKEFGDRLKYVKDPTPEQIKSAEIVLCNIGTSASEGWDRPFELPEDQEKKVKGCVSQNPNTIVMVTSGSGVRMTDWNAQARAIIYAWYGGQTGNQALAEIIAGKTDPSGKLPITIEKEFKDSPGHGYIPEGEQLYTGWNDEKEKARPVYEVHYKEGVFVGYRWYENKSLEPLYPFGHGVSYTTFEYSDLKVSKAKFNANDLVQVTFSIKNTGRMKGMEAAQLYIQDVASSVPRPAKELKGLQKVEIEPGQAKIVQIELSKKDFSFWNPATKDWFAEKGKFIIHVGASSKDIRLKQEVELLKGAND
ncbi:glycoside hydrolase family 3 C-terminal domain-containing protein [candidate division KSB1 bacterium]|nr:glycoside hydrolase family 3 C-terminal domain-containing protein [candidate division KSB1 bacterium]